MTLSVTYLAPCASLDFQIPAKSEDLRNLGCRSAPPSTPQVLYTEKCVRALKGTELSKSKEWKMTPPKTIQWGVYVGEVGEGTETTFRRAPLSPAQSPGTCLHDTVHLSLKLNRGIWDLMLTFQGNFRWRGQGNAGGAMM